MLLSWKWLLFLVLSPVLILLLVWQLNLKIMGEAVIIILFYAIISVVAFGLYYFFTGSSLSKKKDVLAIANEITKRFKEERNEDICFDEQSVVSTKIIEETNTEYIGIRFFVSSSPTKANDIIVVWNNTENKIVNINYNPLPEERINPLANFEPIIHKPKGNYGRPEPVVPLKYVSRETNKANKVKVDEEEMP